EKVALEPKACPYDGLQRTNCGHAAALIVVRAHSPDPAVLELCDVGVDGPPAHLDAGIHMTVDEKRWSPAGAFEPADRLAALALRIEWMRHLLHLDLQAHVGHVVGIEVCDVALLESRARQPDRPLLEIEDTPRIDRGKRRARVDCREHCFSAAYNFAFSAQVGFG